MSVILDTNVVSELMRPAPEDAVVRWLDAQAVATVYLTAVSVAEIRSGIAIMPMGRRRSALHAGFETDVLPIFVGRVLPFDEIAAERFAEIVAGARAAGQPLGYVDAQIAAIAVAHGCSVATRDVLPFETAGVPVINPWEVDD